jgi:4-hydroxybenzoate polyprenyltransferase
MGSVQRAIGRRAQATPDRPNLPAAKADRGSRPAQSFVRVARLLAAACHPGPSLAVTTLAAMLAVAADLAPPRIALLAFAILSGQLVIGWSNDLIDATRDGVVGRTDKPLATGQLQAHVVRLALVVAAVLCVTSSLMLGWRAGLVHLLLVASGLAYNFDVKTTAWSWVPYAVAFGGLPVVVTLALNDPRTPPVWMMLVGAGLGVGAHFVNALPDLDDDARTGIRGLPHRMGGRRAQVTATVVLVLASVAATIGPPGSPPLWSWIGLGIVGLLAVVALRGQGRTPFRAAILIALIDGVTLVLRG